MNINISKIILCKFNQIINFFFYILMIYLKCIVFNYKIYYDMFFIYVLFNILDTYIHYINIYRVMSYFIDRSK